MIGIGRASTGAVAALALTGCVIVSPLVDRRMTDAPNAACAVVNAEPVAEARQCFTLIEEDDRGGRKAWTGGELLAGRTLVAIHRGTAEGCTGRFTHFTVTGASAGPGRAELSTWDAIGRPGHGRQVRWGSGFANRTFALASVDSTLMAPAGARVRVTEGRLDPASLCFKSY